jgi:hypothetical protein
VGHDYFKEPRSLFATRVGDGCMKDTDHQIRHPRGHLGHRASGQKNKKLRMARRSIWTRAKHRVGLERPHFCTRFRGQSDAWGRSSPQRNFVPSLARVTLKILRDMRWKKGSKVKNVRTTHFSFFFSTFFTRNSGHGIDGQRFATTVAGKVTAQNAPNRAGATPLLGAFSRPKFRGIAPARHAGSVTVFWPRAYREAIEPECKVQTILDSTRRGSRWQF